MNPNRKGSYFKDSAMRMYSGAFSLTLSMQSLSFYINTTKQDKGVKVKNQYSEQ